VQRNASKYCDAIGKSPNPAGKAPFTGIQWIRWPSFSDLSRVWVASAVQIKSINPSQNKARKIQQQRAWGVQGGKTERVWKTVRENKTAENRKAGPTKGAWCRRCKGPPGQSSGSEQLRPVCVRVWADGQEIPSVRDTLLHSVGPSKQAYLYPSAHPCAIIIAVIVMRRGWCQCRSASRPKNQYPSLAHG